MVLSPREYTEPDGKGWSSKGSGGRAELQAENL